MITTNAVLVGKFQGPGDEILHRLPIGSSDTLIHQPISQVHWQGHSMGAGYNIYKDTINIYIYIIIIIAIIIIMVM
jgi:hypothetical protein